MQQERALLWYGRCLPVDFEEDDETDKTAKIRGVVRFRIDGRTRFGVALLERQTF